MSRIRLTEKIAKIAAITERLDRIASELEQTNPKIALALDRISDKLEGRYATELRDATPEERKVLNELVEELKQTSGSKNWISIVKSYEKKYGIQFEIKRGSTSWGGTSHPDQDVSIAGTYPRDHKLIFTHGNSIEYKSPIDLVPIRQPQKSPSPTIAPKPQKHEDFDELDF